MPVQGAGLFIFRGTLLSASSAMTRKEKGDSGLEAFLSEIAGMWVSPLNQEEQRCRIAKECPHPNKNGHMIYIPRSFLYSVIRRFLLTAVFFIPDGGREWADLVQTCAGQHLASQKLFRPDSLKVRGIGRGRGQPWKEIGEEGPGNESWIGKSRGNSGEEHFASQTWLSSLGSFCAPIERYTVIIVPSFRTPPFSVSLFWFCWFNEDRYPKKLQKLGWEALLTTECWRNP